MISLSSYKKRFVFVCIYLAFCLMGSLWALLQAVYSILGVCTATTALFLFIVMLSVSAGSMSPQWVVQNITSMTGPAHLRWYRGRPASQIWLPRGRTDPLAVSIALSSCIIVFAVIGVLLTLTLDFYRSLHLWFQCRFFLGAPALYGLDGLIIASIVAPFGYLIGLALALLYRLALSFTTSTGKYQDFEKNIPAYLLAGMACGQWIWPWLMSAALDPLLALWILQIMQVFAVFLLMLAIPRFALIGNQKSFDSSAALLERAPVRQVNPGWLTAAMAVAVGVLLPIVFHLFSLVLPGYRLAHGWLALVFGGLSGGMYLVFRWERKEPMPWQSIVYGCLAGGVSVLGFVWAWQGCWRVWPGGGAPFWRCLAGLACVLFSILLAMQTGALLFYAKQIIQENMVSRSWGWARWLFLTLCGLGAGGLLTQLVVLPFLGSLMGLMIVIAWLSLLAVVITLNHQRLRSRLLRPVSLIALWLFALCGLTAVYLPAAWLRIAPGPGFYLQERSGQAIHCRSDETGCLHTRLAGDERSFGARFEWYAQRNRYLAARLMELEPARMGLVGAESGIWCPQASARPGTLTLVDFEPLFTIDEMANGRLMGGQVRRAALPLSMQLRPNQASFDMIWLILTQDSLLRRQEIYHRQWWWTLQSRLSPQGLIVVDMPGCNPDGDRELAIRRLIQNQFKDAVEMVGQSGLPRHEVGTDLFYLDTGLSGGRGEKVRAILQALATQDGVK